MDTAQIETGTAIALPNEQSLAAMFKAENGLDGLLGELEQRVRSEANGLTVETKKGRDALISLAAKVSKSKAELERQSKALTEQQRKEVALVSAASRNASDRLARLRDETRAPVTAWEEAEAARIQRLKDRLAAIDAGRADALCPSGQIEAVLFEIEAIGIGADWAEYREIAEAKRKTVIGALQGNLAAARDREARDAELAQLRAEAAARAEADRIREAEEAAKRRAEAEEADRKRAAEAKAEADRIAAERAEANRIAAEKAEAARLAQVERDKTEAAERARIEAEQRAAEEKADAEARHQREIAEAEARTAAALQEERDRIAAEAKAKADADAYRAADEAHRSEVLGDIVACFIALEAFDKFTPEGAAAALMAGQIKHVKVML